MVDAGDLPVAIGDVATLFGGMVSLDEQAALTRELMQRGSPAEVRDYVLRMLDDFRTADGGSWLYIEIDPGFKWENVEALVEVAQALRATN